MKRFFSLLFCLGIVSVLNSQDCDEPTAISNFQTNDLSTSLRQGGAFWNAAGNGWGVGIVGENGSNVLYSSGLIIGGLSLDAQLKMAAAGYEGEGTDFYAGPLSTEGLATSSSENCMNWDLFFVIQEQHVARHNSYFDCLGNPDCDMDELFPFGYQIPSYFFDYPAHGDISLNQDFYLAPFYDFDGDGTYDPSNGDAPYFASVYGGDDCCNTLKGHTCAFWISNDNGGLHLYSNSDPIGIEVHNMTYAYSSSNFLNRTLFQQQRIINRGTQTLSDTYVGNFIDIDLGNPFDDLFGSDSSRQAVYAFNGDGMDEEASGTAGFGSVLPALAWVQLNGPLQDADGVDNDGDGVVDNETLNMTNVLGTDLNFFPNFSSPTNLYNNLQSRLANGVHYQENSEDVDFMWQGDMTQMPLAMNEGVTPNDVKIIASSGPFQLTPGADHCLNHALIYNRLPQENAPIAALPGLALQIDSLHADFDACFPCVPPAVNIQVEEISPGVYTFINLAGADEYAWDFGDGSSSDFAFPTHTYSDDGIYTVSLQLENACGSASGSVEIDALTTSVDNAEQLTDISVFPNPARDVVTISGLGGGRTLIRIYNTHGKLVHEVTENVDRLEVPVTEWNAGLYMITIDSMMLSARVANSRQLRFVVE